MEGWGFDIEGNDLYPLVDKVWTIHFKSLDGERHLVVNPFKDSEASTKIKEWIHSFEDGAYVIGHNELGYDAWVLWKLLDCEVAVGEKGSDWLAGKRIQFVDTYFLSMFLTPDRPSHNLESYGKQLKLDKIPYRSQLIDLGVLDKRAPKGAEFKFYHELMEEYCETDVDICLLTFKSLWSLAKKMYGDEWLPNSFKASQKSFYLMNAQEFTGVGFDRDFAEEVENRLVEEIEPLKERVESQLPKRKLRVSEVKAYTIPKNPFKKDGNLSANVIKFIQKHNAIVSEDGRCITAYDQTIEIKEGNIFNVRTKMEIKDQAELKDWLMSLGWEPTLWNVKKGSDGKAVRVKGKLVQTSPKLQEQGNLCPNLDQLDNPVVKDVVKYLSLRNRLGVLQGWRRNPRLDWDGRLPAGSSGITPTFRQRHAVVCNVPKAEEGVLYGKEFRSLFVAEEGNLLASADAAAGENRTEASYTLRYDGGEYAENLLKADPHLINMKAFYPEMSWVDINEEGIKDHPKVRGKRSKSKNGKYALTFGCAPDKLARTLGISPHKAQESYDAFWEANPALKKLKDNVEVYWESKGKKKFLPAVDGRILSTRAKHALLNMLFQSALAIAMDYACCILDQRLGGLKLDALGRPYYLYKGKVVKRVLYYHDEASFEQPPELSQEIADMIADAIVKGGELAKIKIPLDADGEIGKSWAEIH